MWLNTFFLHLQGQGAGATSQAQVGVWFSNTNPEWTAALRSRCVARHTGSEYGAPLGLTSVCVTRHEDIHARSRSAPLRFRPHRVVGSAFGESGRIVAAAPVAPRRTISG